MMKKSVTYFRVPYPPYPRSQRILSFLARRDVAVTTIRGLELRDLTGVRSVARDLVQLWRDTRAGGTVILAELQIRYALPVAMIVKLRRAVLVVDASWASRRRSSIAGEPRWPPSPPVRSPASATSSQSRVPTGS